MLTLRADQSPTKGVYLICHDAAHCKDFHFSDINLVTAVSDPLVLV